MEYDHRGKTLRLNERDRGEVVFRFSGVEWQQRKSSLCVLNIRPINI